MLKKMCLVLDSETIEFLRKNRENKGPAHSWVVREAIKQYYSNNGNNGNNGKVYLELKDETKAKLRQECITKGLTLNQLVNMLIETGLAN